LSDEIAADTTIQEFTDAGDGFCGGELRVYGDVAEFVFEEG